MAHVVVHLVPGGTNRLLALVTNQLIAGRTVRLSDYAAPILQITSRGANDRLCVGTRPLRSVATWRRHQLTRRAILGRLISLFGQIERLETLSQVDGPRWFCKHNQQNDPQRENDRCSHLEKETNFETLSVQSFPTL